MIFYDVKDPSSRDKVISFRKKLGDPNQLTEVEYKRYKTILRFLTDRVPAFDNMDEQTLK